MKRFHPSVLEESTRGRWGSEYTGQGTWRIRLRRKATSILTHGVSALQSSGYSFQTFADFIRKPGDK